MLRQSFKGNLQFTKNKLCDENSELQLKNFRLSNQVEIVAQSISYNIDNRAKGTEI